MRVAPQKWPPRRCSEAMKGQACGRAARPPTISEASAGPGGTGGGGAVSGGGTPTPGTPPGPRRVGLLYCLSSREGRGRVRSSCPGAARPEVPTGCGVNPPLHPHHSEPQSPPHPMRMRGPAGSRANGEAGAEDQGQTRPHSPPSSRASRMGARAGLKYLQLWVMVGWGLLGFCPLCPPVPLIAPTPGGSCSCPTLGPGAPTSSPHPRDWGTADWVMGRTVGEGPVQVTRRLQEGHRFKLRVHN